MRKIIEFLESNNIEYVDFGKNVITGNINITCPFAYCDDPSHHLGINNKGWFACWLNSEHSGKDFSYLIMQLLGISYHSAKALWQDESVNLMDNKFENLFKEDNLETVIENKKLQFPKEFKSIHLEGFPYRFKNYLDYRGITDRILIYYCLTGNWAFRLIFPVYFSGKLVTWVGRSIFYADELPYKNLGAEDSLRVSTDCLYHYDILLGYKGMDTLYIVEGLLDCYKLSSYLPSCKYSTCLFTKVMSESQKMLICNLSKNFKHIKIMLDADAEVEAYKIISELSFLNNVSLQRIPAGYKDPGELPELVIRNL